MNKGYILIDVILCIFILVIIVNILYYVINSTNNLDTIVDYKIYEIDSILYE